VTTKILDQPLLYISRTRVVLLKTDPTKLPAETAPFCKQHGAPFRTGWCLRCMARR
jgi:hypothetical protein